MSSLLIHLFLPFVLHVSCIWRQEIDGPREGLHTLQEKIFEDFNFFAWKWFEFCVMERRSSILIQWAITGLFRVFIRSLTHFTQHRVAHDFRSVLDQLLVRRHVAWLEGVHQHGELDRRALWVWVSADESLIREDVCCVAEELRNRWIVRVACLMIRNLPVPVALLHLVDRHHWTLSHPPIREVDLLHLLLALQSLVECVR